MIDQILADGAIESHDMLLRRVAGADFCTGSLFGDHAEVLMAAARREGERVVYCRDGPESEDEGE